MATYKEDRQTESPASRSGAASETESTMGSKVSDVTSGMRDVAGSVRDVATDVAGQLPTMAAVTRDTIDQATEAMESSSSETLMAGTMLSLGLALGLLIGGASRILVAFALIPAAAMGATLLDRQARTGNTTSSRSTR